MCLLYLHTNLESILESVVNQKASSHGAVMLRVAGGCLRNVTVKILTHLWKLRDLKIDGSLCPLKSFINYWEGRYIEGSIHGTTIVCEWNGSLGEVTVKIWWGYPTDQRGSGGGALVKVFASGARGPGFNSRSLRCDLRDCLSPASKLRYFLKDR